MANFFDKENPKFREQFMRALKVVKGIIVKEFKPETVFDGKQIGVEFSVVYLFLTVEEFESFLNDTKVELIKNIVTVADLKNQEGNPTRQTE